MSIKDKPLKKRHSDKRITIDVIHSDILDNMKTDEITIEELKKELDKINNNNKELDRSSIAYRDNMLKIKNIEKKIKNIENNNINYYLDNGMLLNNYYNKDFKKNNIKKNTEKNNILDFLKSLL